MNLGYAQQPGEYGLAGANQFARGADLRSAVRARLDDSLDRMNGKALLERLAALQRVMKLLEARHQPFADRWISGGAMRGG